MYSLCGLQQSSEQRWQPGTFEAGAAWGNTADQPFEDLQKKQQDALINAVENLQDSTEWDFVATDFQLRIIPKAFQRCT